MGTFSAVELCAGAGGQAIGLERAGFDHAVAVEIDPMASATLRLNRPEWNVIEGDIANLHGRDFRHVDLLAGGIPCPPFSVAGKQLGADDERDLFPQVLRLVHEAKPRALLVENVPGFASAKFTDYRNNIMAALAHMGYQAEWRVLHAEDFGVPQLRPRFILVAFRGNAHSHFRWPVALAERATVADAVQDLMGEHGWPGLPAWVAKAARVAPTLVGGSKKHGGPDLGPTRARAQWSLLGVDGRGLADAAPAADAPADIMPRLTVRMAARVQAFPDEWQFAGRKTAAYRQVGNALPPPVAYAVGVAIAQALEGSAQRIEIPHGYVVQPRLI